MSRIGKKPIDIKDCNISINDNTITVKGKLGELTREFDSRISVVVENNQIIVTRPNDEKTVRSLHGLTRSLIQNMVTGVTEGFKRGLEIVGVGYKAELKGQNLVITVGYSHPICFQATPEIKIEVPAPTQISITGIDKELVGLIAAKIRSFKKPEPYKGKGIKYAGEVIVRKAGKAAGK